MQKNRSRKAGPNLSEYISEALRESEENLKALSASAPPAIDLGYPYFDVGLVSAKVSKKLGPPEHSVREIERRLKQFAYPYELGTKRAKTFYQYAKSKGVLRSLLAPPLLWNIRAFWWSERVGIFEAQLRETKGSSYGLPLAFHKGLALLLSAHLSAIDRLLTKHRVTRSSGTKAWFEAFKKYRSATLKQLLSEAAIYYPKVQEFRFRKPEPATKDRMTFRKIEAEVELFKAVQSTLRARGTESENFAAQLTAVFCTSQAHIRDNELSPTPQTIRLNAEWLKKRHKVGLSKKHKS